MCVMENLVNLWNEAETNLKMKTVNVSGGTFTSGRKYGTWVNGFNKQKKKHKSGSSLFWRYVYDVNDISQCQPAQILPISHQKTLRSSFFSKFCLHKIDTDSRKHGGLFTFYSQKYKVVCQEHHFVQNCTDTSKLSHRQRKDGAVRSEKKLNRGGRSL